MFSGPFKILLGAGVLAALAGGVLSNNLAPPAQSGAASKAASAAVPQKSWYSRWFEGMEIGRAPAPAPKPAQVQAAAMGGGYGRVDLRADSGGQYHADVEIEGQRIAMLVDTGATLIALTADDASRLGVRPAPSDYSLDIQTANGMAKAARVNLREVRLGTLEVRNVDALVLPLEVKGRSLLGMSFLKKLRFETDAGTLILRQ